MQITNFRSLFLSSGLKKSVMITFVKDDGTEVKRRAEIGKTLQNLVEVNNDPDIPGYGLCRGDTSCSTCHVIFSKEIFEKLEPATSDEEDILVYVPDYCDTSRLGCNVKITKDMDGLVVTVPSAKRDQRP
ncbi:hypothetical protein JTE90_004337 [Oedothorax gibbosus]|uniref:2Fe-2S ferredoxin-type domain-containing protein n=1 Tax=Oedothorax gibbosus TaxID=931172 RepID=A0AAV6VJU4_9ARAC|nr:hypothetical protein JTE90_004337 [Oedothorax gibbosus]